MKMLFSMSLFLLPIISFAQSSGYKLIAANKFYQQGDFYSAAKLYEQTMDSSKASNETSDPYMFPSISKSLNTHKNNPSDITYRLGMSHYKLRNFVNAEKWFKKSKDENHLALFYYAVCLKANQQYEDAAKEFNTYLSIIPVDTFYSKLAAKELKEIDFINAQTNPLNKSSFIINHLTEQSGENTSNYAISKMGQDYVLTSTRPDTALSAANRNPYMNRLYTASIKDSILKVITKIDIISSDGKHNGAAAFTPDGNKLFFTQWYKNWNDTVAAIYVTEKKGNAWQPAAALNNSINQEGYKSIQPFVTTDGKYLLFSSDKPGGEGKYDLWYAPLDKDYQPGTAINMGNIINTNGNEQTPFYYSGNNTLIFSSDTRIGMGGYDLYKSKGDFSQWDTVVNLGYPINSSKDDLYFYSGDTDSLWQHGYISSDRSSDCCLQLFAVTAIIPPKEIPVIKDTELIVKDSSIQQTVANPVTYVYFDFNKSVIPDSSDQPLDQLAMQLRNDPLMTLEIAAYTDGFGSIDYNLSLSSERAISCKNYFLSKGVKEKQLVIHYYGKCCPVAPEQSSSGKDDPDGRQKNRRAELKLGNK